MKNIPTRDITGECAGECRNLVREGEERRQAEINTLGVESPESFPGVSSAFSRNAAPGFLGGHV